MATWYANSITGTAGGAGTSWATAVATLEQAMALTAAGDTIVCHGRFVGAVPVTRQVFWVGYGRCVFDGNASGTANTIPAGSTNTSFTGIEFTNWTGAVIASNYAASFSNCLFHDIGVAGSGAFCYTNCAFYNCTGSWSSILYGAINLLANGQARNCILFNNIVDINLTTANPAIYNCVLGSPIMIKVGATALSSGDYNCFNFNGTNKCIVNGVDKTTLATWQTAMTAPTDLNSYNRPWTTNGDVGDAANNMLYNNPASPLNTLGPGSTPIGIQKPAACISANSNPSYWTGAVFSGCEIDITGKIVLSAGYTVGTVAFNVFPVGANWPLYSIQVGSTNLSTNNIIDTDTGDSPGYRNCEFRGSSTIFAKDAVSPAWVTVPIGVELGSIISPNNFAYAQVRLTLRGN